MLFVENEPATSSCPSEVLTEELETDTLAGGKVIACVDNKMCSQWLTQDLGPKWRGQWSL